jgi:hypothetical protein
MLIENNPPPLKIRITNSWHQQQFIIIFSSPQLRITCMHFPFYFFSFFSTCRHWLGLLMNDVRTTCPQEMWWDDKEREICTAGLEFESGRASLVRACDSWSFTRSPGPTKCASRRWGFLKFKKKKNKYEQQIVYKQ